MNASNFFKIIILLFSFHSLQVLSSSRRIKVVSKKCSVCKSSINNNVVMSRECKHSACHRCLEISLREKFGDMDLGELMLLERVAVTCPHRSCKAEKDLTHFLTLFFHGEIIALVNRVVKAHPERLKFLLEETKKSFLVNLTEDEFLILYRWLLRRESRSSTNSFLVNHLKPWFNTQHRKTVGKYLEEIRGIHTSADIVESEEDAETLEVLDYCDYKRESFDTDIPHGVVASVTDGVSLTYVRIG